MHNENQNQPPRAAGQAAQTELELFRTAPHADQALIDLLDLNDPAEPITNRLYALRSFGLDGETNEICLTGEELDSLAHQWLKHRNEQLAKGVAP